MIGKGSLFEKSWYDFQLTVSNSLGLSNHAKVRVFKSEDPVPLILVHGGLVRGHDRSKPLRIEVTARPASCRTDEPMGYLWDVGDVLANKLDPKVPPSKGWIPFPEP